VYCKFFARRRSTPFKKSPLTNRRFEGPKNKLFSKLFSYFSIFYSSGSGWKEKISDFFRAGFGEGTPQQVSVRGGRWSRKRNLEPRTILALSKPPPPQTRKILKMKKAANLFFFDSPLSAKHHHGTYSIFLKKQISGSVF